MAKINHTANTNVSQSDSTGNQKIDLSPLGNYTSETSLEDIADINRNIGNQFGGIVDKAAENVGWRQQQLVGNDFGATNPYMYNTYYQPAQTDFKSEMRVQGTQEALSEGMKRGKAAAEAAAEAAKKAYSDAYAAAEREKSIRDATSNPTIASVDDSLFGDGNEFEEARKLLFDNPGENVEDWNRKALGKMVIDKEVDWSDSNDWAKAAENSINSFASQEQYAKWNDEERQAFWDRTDVTNYFNNNYAETQIYRTKGQEGLNDYRDAYNIASTAIQQTFDYYWGYSDTLTEDTMYVLKNAFGQDNSLYKLPDLNLSQDVIKEIGREIINSGIVTIDKDYGTTPTDAYKEGVYTKEEEEELERRAEEAFNAIWKSAAYGGNLAFQQIFNEVKDGEYNYTSAMAKLFMQGISGSAGDANSSDDAYRERIRTMRDAVGQFAGYVSDHDENVRKKVSDVAAEALQQKYWVSDTLSEALGFDFQTLEWFKNLQKNEPDKFDLIKNQLSQAYGYSDALEVADGESYYLVNGEYTKLDKGSVVIFAMPGVVENDGSFNDDSFKQYVQCFKDLNDSTANTTPEQREELVKAMNKAWNEYMKHVAGVSILQALTGNAKMSTDMYKAVMLNFNPNNDKTRELNIGGKTANEWFEWFNGLSDEQKYSVYSSVAHDTFQRTGQYNIMNINGEIQTMGMDINGLKSDSLYDNMDIGIEDSVVLFEVLSAGIENGYISNDFYKNGKYDSGFFSTASRNFTKTFLDGAKWVVDAVSWGVATAANAGNYLFTGKSLNGSEDFFDYNYIQAGSITAALTGNEVKAGKGNIFEQDASDTLEGTYTSDFEINKMQSENLVALINPLMVDYYFADEGEEKTVKNIGGQGNTTRAKSWLPGQLQGVDYLGLGTMFSSGYTFLSTTSGLAGNIVFGKALAKSTAYLKNKISGAVKGVTDTAKAKAVNAATKYLVNVDTDDAAAALGAGLADDIADGITDAVKASGTMAKASSIASEASESMSSIVKGSLDDAKKSILKNITQAGLLDENSTAYKEFAKAFSSELSKSNSVAAYAIEKAGYTADELSTIAKTTAGSLLQETYQRSAISFATGLSDDVVSALSARDQRLLTKAFNAKAGGSIGGSAKSLSEKAFLASLSTEQLTKVTKELATGAAEAAKNGLRWTSSDTLRVLGSNGWTKANSRFLLKEFGRDFRNDLIRDNLRNAFTPYLTEDGFKRQTIDEYFSNPMTYVQNLTSSAIQFGKQRIKAHAGEVYSQHQLDKAYAAYQASGSESDSSTKAMNNVMYWSDQARKYANMSIHAGNDMVKANENLEKANACVMASMAKAYDSFQVDLSTGKITKHFNNEQDFVNYLKEKKVNIGDATASAVNAVIVSATPAWYKDAVNMGAFDTGGLGKVKNTELLKDMWLTHLDVVDEMSDKVKADDTLSQYDKNKKIYDTIIDRLCDKYSKQIKNLRGSLTYYYDQLLSDLDNKIKNSADGKAHWRLGYMPIDSFVADYTDPILAGASFGSSTIDRNIMDSEKERALTNNELRELITYAASGKSEYTIDLGNGEKTYHLKAQGLEFLNSAVAHRNSVTTYKYFRPIWGDNFNNLTDAGFRTGEMVIRGDDIMLTAMKNDALHAQVAIGELSAKINDAVGKEVITKQNEADTETKGKLKKLTAEQEAKIAAVDAEIEAKIASNKAHNEKNAEKIRAKEAEIDTLTKKIGSFDKTLHGYLPEELSDVPGKVLGMSKSEGYKLYAEARQGVQEIIELINNGVFDLTDQEILKYRIGEDKHVSLDKETTQMLRDAAANNQMFTSDLVIRVMKAEQAADMAKNVSKFADVIKSSTAEDGSLNIAKMLDAGGQEVFKHLLYSTDVPENKKASMFHDAVSGIIELEPEKYVKEVSKATGLNPTDTVEAIKTYGATFYNGQTKFDLLVDDNDNVTIHENYLDDSDQGSHFYVNETDTDGSIHRFEIKRNELDKLAVTVNEDGKFNGDIDKTFAPVEEQIQHELSKYKNSDIDSAMSYVKNVVKSTLTGDPGEKITVGDIAKAYVTYFPDTEILINATTTSNKRGNSLTAMFGWLDRANITPATVIKEIDSMLANIELPKADVDSLNATKSLFRRLLGHSEKTGLRIDLESITLRNGGDDGVSADDDSEGPLTAWDVNERTDVTPETLAAERESVTNLSKIAQNKNINTDLSLINTTEDRNVILNEVKAATNVLARMLGRNAKDPIYSQAMSTAITSRTNSSRSITNIVNNIGDELLGIYNGGKVSKNASNNDVDIWSQKEGWSTDWWNKNKGHYKGGFNVEYEYIGDKLPNKSKTIDVPMNMAYGKDARSAEYGATTMEAIRNGKRTSTTRAANDKYSAELKNAKVGDIVAMHGKDWNKDVAYVRITKAASDIPESMFAQSSSTKSDMPSAYAGAVDSKSLSEFRKLVDSARDARIARTPKGVRASKEVTATDCLNAFGVIGDAQVLTPYAGSNNTTVEEYTAVVNNPEASDFDILRTQSAYGGARLKQVENAISALQGLGIELKSTTPGAIEVAKSTLPVYDMDAAQFDAYIKNQIELTLSDDTKAAIAKAGIKVSDISTEDIRRLAEANRRLGESREAMTSSKKNKLAVKDYAYSVSRRSNVEQQIASVLAQSIGKNYDKMSASAKKDLVNAINSIVVDTANNGNIQSAYSSRTRNTAAGSIESAFFATAANVRDDNVYARRYVDNMVAKNEATQAQRAVTELEKQYARLKRNREKSLANNAKLYLNSDEVKAFAKTHNDENPTTALMSRAKNDYKTKLDALESDFTAQKNAFLSQVSSEYKLADNAEYQKVLSDYETQKAELRQSYNEEVKYIKQQQSEYEAQYKKQLAEGFSNSKKYAAINHYFDKQLSELKNNIEELRGYADEKWRAYVGYTDEADRLDYYDLNKDTVVWSKNNDKWTATKYQDEVKNTAEITGESESDVAERRLGRLRHGSMLADENYAGKKTPFNPIQLLSMVPGAVDTYEHSMKPSKNVLTSGAMGDFTGFKVTDFENDTTIDNFQMSNDGTPEGSYFTATVEYKNRPKGQLMFGYDENRYVDVINEQLKSDNRNMVIDYIDNVEEQKNGSQKIYGKFHYLGDEEAAGSDGAKLSGAAKSDEQLAKEAEILNSELTKQGIKAGNITEKNAAKAKKAFLNYYKQINPRGNDADLNKLANDWANFIIKGSKSKDTSNLLDESNTDYKKITRKDGTVMYVPKEDASTYTVLNPMSRTSTDLYSRKYVTGDEAAEAIERLQSYEYGDIEYAEQSALLAKAKAQLDELKGANKAEDEGVADLLAKKGSYQAELTKKQAELEEKLAKAKAKYSEEVKLTDKEDLYAKKYLTDDEYNDWKRYKALIEKDREAENVNFYQAEDGTIYVRSGFMPEGFVNLNTRKTQCGFVEEPKDSKKKDKKEDKKPTKEQIKEDTELRKEMQKQINANQNTKEALIGSRRKKEQDYVAPTTLDRASQKATLERLLGIESSVKIKTDAFNIDDKYEVLMSKNYSDLVTSIASFDSTGLEPGKIKNAYFTVRDGLISINKSFQDWQLAGGVGNINAYTITWARNAVARNWSDPKAALTYVKMFLDTKNSMTAIQRAQDFMPLAVQVAMSTGDASYITDLNGAMSKASEIGDGGVLADLTKTILKNVDNHKKHGDNDVAAAARKITTVLDSDDDGKIRTLWNDISDDMDTLFGNATFVNTLPLLRLQYLQNEYNSSMRALKRFDDLDAGEKHETALLWAHAATTDFFDPSSHKKTVEDMLANAKSANTRKTLAAWTGAKREPSLMDKAGSVFFALRFKKTLLGQVANGLKSLPGYIGNKIKLFNVHDSTEMIGGRSAISLAGQNAMNRGSVAGIEAMALTAITAAIWNSSLGVPTAWDSIDWTDEAGNVKIPELLKKLQTLGQIWLPNAYNPERGLYVNQAERAYKLDPFSSIFTLPNGITKAIDKGLHPQGYYNAPQRGLGLIGTNFGADYQGLNSILNNSWVRGISDEIFAQTLSPIKAAYEILMNTTYYGNNIWERKTLPDGTVNKNYDPFRNVIASLAHFTNIDEYTNNGYNSYVKGYGTEKYVEQDQIGTVGGSGLFQHEFATMILGFFNGDALEGIIEFGELPIKKEKISSTARTEFNTTVKHLITNRVKQYQDSVASIEDTAVKDSNYVDMCRDCLKIVKNWSAKYNQALQDDPNLEAWATRIMMCICAGEYDDNLDYVQDAYWKAGEIAQIEQGKFDFLDDEDWEEWKAQGKTSEEFAAEKNRRSNAYSEACADEYKARQALIEAGVPSEYFSGYSYKNYRAQQYIVNKEVYQGVHNALNQKIGGYANADELKKAYEARINAATSEDDKIALAKEYNTYITDTIAPYVKDYGAAIVNDVYYDGKGLATSVADYIIIPEDKKPKYTGKTPKVSYLKDLFKVGYKVKDNLKSDNEVIELYNTTLKQIRKGNTASAGATIDRIMKNVKSNKWYVSDADYSRILNLKAQLSARS